MKQKMNIIYCDHSATTKINNEVLEEMLPYLSKEYGNASSIYSLGIRSKEAINIAREKVARAINCKNKEIYFTSCGSESDNLAIKGFCYANKEKGNHIITSKIEHPAILNTCKTLEKQGFKITYLDVDKNGFVDIQDIEKNIKDNTILITIMMANNEIGTIEPISEIGKLAKSRKIIFHTDAVQAVGNIKIDVQKMNIDMLSMSAHKFYGPKGIGALYVREGVKFDRIIDGGHQEREKRSGTENVAEIVGLGKAIELADRNLNEYNKKLYELREYFIRELEKSIGTENMRINGDRRNRLPGNANITFKQISSKELLNKLDKMGICASGGSACSSSCSTPSHVLNAIGISNIEALNTVRFTFGEENNPYEIQYIVRCINYIIKSKLEK